MIFSSNPSENQELNKYAIWLARTFPLSTIEKKSVEKNQHPFIFFIITAGLARTEDEVEITAEYSIVNFIVASENSVRSEVWLSILGDHSQSE